MTRSGIKQGLAVSAVAALATVGLPAAAHAASIVPADDSVNLVSVASGAPASIKNDGTNQTLSLVATAGDEVNQIQFSYTDASGAHTIATVSRDAHGTFSYEWTVPAALLGSAVDINATAVDVAGSAANTVDTETGVVLTANADAVELAPSNAAIGLYNGKGAVSGTSSDKTTTSPAHTGQVDLSGDNGTTSTPADVAADGTFTGIVSAPSGYTWLSDADKAAGGVDRLVVQASTSGGDLADAQAYEVYKAEIKGITASADHKVQAGNATSPVTINVTDQNGAPVVGATVVVNPNASASYLGETLTTNAHGVAVDGSGAKPSLAAGSYTAYAETNGTPGYQEGGDYLAAVTVSPTGAEASAVATSKIGNAFDVDELGLTGAANDVVVQVKDQDGTPLNNKIVYYTWHYAPFSPDKAVSAGGNGNIERDLTPANVPSGGTTTLADGTKGATNIPLPTLNTSDLQGGTFTLKAYVNTDGIPGQGTGDVVVSASPIKMGESSIAFDDNGFAQRQAGTTQTLTGKLVLDDGTVLPNRQLNVALNDSTGSGDSDENNTKLAAAAAQPAGVVRTSDTSASLRTGADGSFSIAITDPAAVSPATLPAREDSLLKVTGVATDTGVAPNVPGVGTDATDTETVEFLADVAPASVDIDPLGDAAPGQARAVTLTVRNAAGEALSTDVALSTNHGYFSKPATAAQAAAFPGAFVAGDAVPVISEGGLVGQYVNDGAALTVHTDRAGEATVFTAVGRDADLDDNGLAKTTVSAKAGSVTGTQKFNFTTQSDSDNLSSFALGFTSEQDQSGLSHPAGYTDGSDGVVGLPAAAANREVHVSLSAKDQFGNLVAQSATVSDDTSKAWAPANTDGAFAGQPSFQVYDGSTQETVDQTVTAETSNNEVTWHKNAAGQWAQKTASADKSADLTINWYAINWAGSTYSLTHTGAASQGVGSTVTVTYTAVDQTGKPIVGAPVDFYRAGPDANQDGDTKAGYFTTDQNGKVTYTFAGAEAGTAQVTAVAEDVNGNPIAASQKVTTVAFTTSAPVVGTPAPTHPTPTPAKPAVKSVKGHSQGKKDVLVIKVANANGKRVVVKSHGKVVGHGVVRHGQVVVKVADKNGNKKTRYQVVVAGAKKFFGIK